MKPAIGILAALLALAVLGLVYFVLDARNARADLARLTAETDTKIQAAIDRTKAEGATKAREDRAQLERQIEKQIAEKLADMKARLAAAERKAAEQGKASGDLARKLGGEKADLEKRLKTAGQTPQELKVAERGGGLEITVADRVLFDSGSATLRHEGRDVLRKIAESLRNDPGRGIRVAGHTDSRAIRDEFRGVFDSNWELASARATAAVRFLQDACGLPPERLAVQAFGPGQPVASNDTEEGRAQNRRIEILIAPATPPPR